MVVLLLLSLSLQPILGLLLGQHGCQSAFATSKETRILSKELTVSFQPGKDRTLYHCRYTFLVGGAGKYADFSYVDRFSGRRNFKPGSCWILSPSGDKKNLPKKAMRISNAFRENILYSDDFRVKWRLNNIEIGSTVSLDYTIYSRELIDYSSLYLQEDWMVDTTIIQFDFPENGRLQLFEANLEIFPVEIRTQAVHAGHITVRESSPFDGGYTVASPRVDFSFHLDDEKPRTWNDIAEEILELWDRVNTKIVLKQDELEAIGLNAFLDGGSRRFEEAFRYVAIYIGDGRFIPHRPRDVFREKYGDCKDLSFFLTTALKQQQFDIYPVLVNAPSHYPFDPNIPSMFQFNHAIVGLLNGEDTLYYDPTSKGFPPGMPPWGDQGVPALWLKHHSDLIYLPRDTIPIAITREFNGMMDENGTLSGSITLSFDERLSNLFLTKADREELLETIRMNICSERAIEIVTVEANPESLSLTGEVKIRNCAVKARNKFYCSPNPFRSLHYLPDSVGSAGESGYHLSRPVLCRDTVSIALPSEIAQNKTYEDSLKSDVGFSEFKAFVNKRTLQGKWIHCFTRSQYPREKKAKLNLLINAIEEHRGIRVGIETSD